MRLCEILSPKSGYKYHYIPNDSGRKEHIIGYGIATKAGANADSFGNRKYDFPIENIDPKDIVGSVYIKKNDYGQYHGSALNVDQDHRRKQVASNLYNHIEAKLGEPLVPENELSHDGKRFWSGRGKYPGNMRLNEILKEHTIRAEDGTGGMYIITKNPSRQQFIKLTSSLDCDMKGLIDGKDFYCWAAWHAHHGQVAHALGLQDAKMLFIQHNLIAGNESIKELVLNNPNLKYLYNNKIPFHAV